MKILFIVPSYKPAYIYGGPIVVISLLAENLVQMGHEVTVYTTTANGKSELDVTPQNKVKVDGVDVYYFKRITKDHTHISPSLWKHLYKTAKEYDVIHMHSWWNILMIGAAWICKLKGIKPLLSPHGMFSDYILTTNNSLKKEAIHKLIGKRLLSNTYLHVSTDLEWEESHKIINNWEGEIIPNPVILSNHVHPKPINDVFTIGFLSRVDPKKGIDILMKALKGVSFPYKLKIAGDGEKDYIDSLKKLSIDLGIEQSVEWVGWKKGEEKFNFFAELDLFALTSHSENFAIVVIESLSVGTPVLLSDQVGLAKYVEENNLGWITTLNIQNITDQLHKAMIEKEKTSTINKVAPEFIKLEYNTASLTSKYISFYKKIS